MDSAIEDMAIRYKSAQEEGQQWIRTRWRGLEPTTKATLQSSGLYSDRGSRLPDPQNFMGEAQDSCEELEYSLGVLKRCIDSKLPSRAETGASIPSEALEGAVLSSCETLLYNPNWHDPQFLRLGLRAVVVNQEANALTMVGNKPKASAQVGCLGMVFKVGLVLLLPVSLALGISAAARQDVMSSVLAFYLGGGGIIAALSIAGVSTVKRDPFEQALSAWTWFRISDGTGVVGAGAHAHLKRMVTEGIRVPSVALDLAALTYSRISRHDGVPVSVG